ncbi:hypothetical protein COMA2_20135 [Candidatus Nitrospira nitrificans]|uniref:Uncharacterized protein n=1 Tax=Candidatus Nitrospira nitrificans TaxID=1742973 RepID=A0A0S4LE96_9BACT|nr:hypothetical protein COMA2_20135 [Candidatus Nitrospira nitrificans]
MKVVSREQPNLMVIAHTETEPSLASERDERWHSSEGVRRNERALALRNVSLQQT